MKKLLTIALAILLLSATYADDVVDHIRQQRVDRVQACTQAKHKYQDWITDRYYINQDFVARCATYMHLVYAYESNFGASNRCINHNNCFGIKEPTATDVLDNIQYTIADNRFLIFNTKQDGNQVFANLYARWHMNKHINTFVYNRSMTHRNTYISFMRDHYWGLYHYYLSLIQ